jgi:hypothetical protein
MLERVLLILTDSAKASALTDNAAPPMFAALTAIPVSFVQTVLARPMPIHRQLHAQNATSVYLAPASLLDVVRIPNKTESLAPVAFAETANA